MQRSIINSYNGPNKRQRVNSVTKDIHLPNDSKNEITPIEEVCTRPNKYKRSRILQEKQGDKIAKVYGETKNKDIKLQNKHNRNNLNNKSGKKKLVHQRTTNADLVAENIIEECNFDSPIKYSAYKIETNILEKVKQMSTLESIHKNALYNSALDDHIQNGSITKTMLAKDRMKFLLNNDKSIKDNQKYHNEKLYKTAQHLSKDLHYNMQYIDSQYGILKYFNIF